MVKDTPDLIDLNPLFEVSNHSLRFFYIMHTMDLENLMEKSLHVIT